MTDRSASRRFVTSNPLRAVALDLAVFSLRNLARMVATAERWTHTP